MSDEYSNDSCLNDSCVNGNGLNDSCTNGAGSDDLGWLMDSIAVLNKESMESAIKHQANLTKPHGSLGLLEDVAVRFAGMQKRSDPSIEHITVRIFAADHGVAAEGVSAYPQAVTGEMVRNFARGGAAISVLAKRLRADFGVTVLGTAEPLESLPNVAQHIIAPMTGNFLRQPAMSQQQLQQALGVGKCVAESAHAAKSQLFIGGEMGIANTTSASALASVLLREPVEHLVGRGTGLDSAGVERKSEIIKSALTLHGLQGPNQMMDFKRSEEIIHLLATVGGFEIAALTGCYLRCGQLGIPILVDGFIASVAALVAEKISSEVKEWFFYGHLSEEYGHKAVLKALGAKPLLQLNMRLGEASGAAMAVPILQNALALHNGMATFADANVSEVSETVEQVESDNVELTVE